LPVIQANGVVNAASNDIGQGLAPGSHMTIYGDSLATTTVQERTASLPLSLATVSVSFDAPGISVPGRLTYVSPGEVDVQIPWELEGQPSVQIKVSIGDISSSLYTVPLATYAPAIFTRNGIAVAYDGAGKAVDASNPAARGSTVDLYVNGLGPVDHGPPSGEPTPAQQPAPTRVNASVTIGGRPGQVTFSGLAPDDVGVYLVRANVPADTTTGTVPVVVSIGGVDSKPVNMPVQ
jgi:uncharacterized protein (TIGR03437 family)